jgi:hypothetical protein
MRESSYNLSKQNSQQPKDIRGGEKKVMKKSLSTILSLAMAFSMFSSVALAADEAAKTSADFSDLKDLDADTKAKFDALISAGVFDGVSEGVFGLKDEMNRAQFAKVAALIFNLKVDTSLKTSSFEDVKADDPANGYALPYIEAVKAAGITDGYGPGEFNPAGKVTKEQLAAFLIRGINKDADAKATPGVNDDTVSDWAKGYVALALNLKLLANGADGKFGGTTNATRDLLVLGAYEGKQQYKPVFNGKYAIASLKATDADVLTLELNGTLTEEAAKAFKLEVKKDSSVVTNYTTTWNDAKTIATLKFDTKFQDTTYTATISGVTNLDETNNTATVAVTKERIAKIEFLTAADTLPRTIKDLKIEFKATNQYGAKSTLSYNNFSINTGSDVTVKGVSGEQAFYITQAPSVSDPTQSKLERNDRVSVTIIHEDSGVTANKVFAIGEAQNVSKIEIGDLKNSSNVTVETVEAEKDVYLEFKAYDQYGIPVEDFDTLNKGVTFYSTEGNVKRVTTHNNQDVWFTPTNEIGDDAADLKFRYGKNEAKDAVTLTVIANGSGQTVTKTVKVSATKIPAAVEFGTYSYTLAEGDDATGLTDSDLLKKFYVPVIVKDAKGDTLTPQEIADKAYKFTIYSTGGINLDTSNTVYDDNNVLRNTPIVQSGEHKGKIAVRSATSKGSAGITVQLLDTPTVSAKFSTSVGDRRKADKIAFSTAAKKYMIAGTDNEFKLKVYDQHGGELKLNDARYKVELKLNANTDISSVTTATYDNNGTAGVTTDDVKYYGLVVKSNDVLTPSAGTGTVAGSTKKFALQPTSANRQVFASLFDGTTYNTQQYLDLNDVFDKSFKFFTNAQNLLPGDSANLNLVNGVYNTATPPALASKVVVPNTTYTLTATLVENTTPSGAPTYREIGNTSTTLEVLNVNDDKNKLVYEVYLDKGVNNTIFAASEYLGGLDAQATPVAKATYLNTATPTGLGYTKVAKDVKVRAKNSSGQDVSIPSTIVSVSSSNPNVATTISTNKLFGLNAGTTKLNVQFKDAKGEVKVGSVDVTTKNEGPVVASIVAKKSGNTVSRATVNGTVGGVLPWDATLAEKLTVKDQFGNEYVSDRAVGTQKDDGGGNTDQFVQQHQGLLNLTYFASDIKTNNNEAGVVTFNSTTGNLENIGGNVTGFTLNILAPSGVSAAVSVVVTN